MDAKVIWQKINETPLFAGLGADEVKEVLTKANASVKKFHKSDYIYMAGDCVESLCVVLEGAVQIIKEDIWGDKAIIANLGSGSVFAENYLGRKNDRITVSYFSTSDSEVLMLPLVKMLNNGNSNVLIRSKLACNIISILADNNTKMIEKAEILSKKTLRGKILAYLEQEAQNQGCAKFTIPFNRTDLANYLDADRSALTRELAKMRDEGLVAFEKNTFELLKKND